MFGGEEGQEDLQTVLRVVEVAHRWHARGRRSLLQLPRFVGANLGYIAPSPDRPTNVKGLCCRVEDGSVSIILNEQIAGSSEEAYILAHEAFHVAAGFNSVALCATDEAETREERLAWLGPPLFLVPERVGHAIVDAGFGHAYAIARQANAVPLLAVLRASLLISTGVRDGNIVIASQMVDAGVDLMLAWSQLTSSFAASAGLAGLHDSLRQCDVLSGLL